MKLTKEEKIELLKKYLVDEVYVKSIIETLNEEELDNWIETNLEVLTCGVLE